MEGVCREIEERKSERGTKDKTEYQGIGQGLTSRMNEGKESTTLL